jgi:hypothetical protein
LSIFEGMGLEGLGLEALGLEWWAIAALLFLLPKLVLLLVALLFMFAEKIPGFENFAGGRLKAFKDRINLQLSGNVQKLVSWVRPAPKP